MGGDEESEDEDMGQSTEPASMSDEDKKLVVALLNNCAMARLKTGDAEAAKDDCTKVLKYDEKNVKAFFRRGQAELALGNFSGCVEEAAKALEIDPNNKEAEQLRRKAHADEKAHKQKEKAMCSKMF